MHHAPHKSSSLPPTDKSKPALVDPLAPDEELDDAFEEDPLFAPDDSAEQEQIHELVSDYDLAVDTAERVSDLMEKYGVDAEAAIDMEEGM